MLTNSIMQLRADELARAQRPFHARGSKVVRCEQCLLPSPQCICQFKPSPLTDCAVVFIMYKGEYYKPTNTGRLIADVVAENYAFLWHRTEPDKSLLALLRNPRYQPIVVFPHEYAAPPRCIHTLNKVNNKKPLFIFLDGTWREARKMFGKSPYLDNIPVLGVSPDIASNYLLRESSHGFQHCTAEVGVSVLDLAGEKSAAQALAHYFSVFRHHYLMGKPHLSHKIEFAKSQVG
nr:DTW domain-containing protein [Alteromonas profundi]